MTTGRAASTSWQRSARGAGQPSPQLTAALERARAFFAERSTRPAVLARGMSGRPLTGDAVLTDHLIRERRRQTRMDGSVQGSFTDTAKTLSELLDLACPPDHAAVVRTLGYVLSRQDQPGHFGEGCSAERHAAGECRHALRGFFSPASRDDEFTPQRFPTGVVIRDEENARFAASCFALRVVLRAREDRRRAVQDHLDSLIRLDSLWDLANDRWDPDVRVFAVAALSAAPFEHRAAASRCGLRFIEAQQEDGTWPETNHVHALDALLGFPTQEAYQAIVEGTPALLACQSEDGSFSTDGDEEITLIAMRVLARVAAI